MSAMDSFTFSVATGPVSVFFHPDLSVPEMPPAGGIYIADSNTRALLEKSARFDPARPLVIIEPGEEHKQLESIERILETALSAGLGRDSLFVGFGGGVITDMAAFAASLYMRGAQLELVPTTLLAMADAAIGGKTGVDFGNYKNCVGTFYPARAVHIPVSALETLPEAEFRSGLAEVFKTALLYAPKLFQIMGERKKEILARDPELLLEVVKRCVQAKAHVVERDLRETGERMYLNLGHTFGHALESVAGFGTVSHGEAVAWGIARALELGKSLGITDESYIADVLPVLESYGWSSAAVHPVLASRVASGDMDKDDVAPALLSAMKNDKKKKQGKIRFVLQREINSTLVTEAGDQDVLAVLA
jgi:3-dehydroquinate synthase